MKTIKSYKSNEFISRHLPYLIAKSNALYADSKVKFLSYTRQYDDGKALVFSTHTQWLDYVLKNYNTQKCLTPRLKVGMNHWDKNKNRSIQKMNAEAKDNFNIHAHVEFVYRDNIQKCHHMYAFYTDQKHVDTAQMLYRFQKIILLEILADLNKQGYENLKPTGKDRAYFMVQDYCRSIENIKTFDQFKHIITKNSFYKGSSYEMEALVLYAATGLTIKEISQLFYLLPEIKDHDVSVIRAKANMEDRKSLDAYIKENGQYLVLYVQLVAANIADYIKNDKKQISLNNQTYQQSLCPVG